MAGLTPRLLGPSEAGALLARRIDSTWAKRIVAETHGERQEGVTIRLRPGIGTPGAVAKVGFGAWHEWCERWRAPWDEFTSEAAGDQPSIAGVVCVAREIRVQGLPELAPYELRIDSLAAALAVLRVLGYAAASSPLERARRIARRLHTLDATLTPRTLQACCRLADGDVEVLFGAIEFLCAHDDLSEWTERQLPVVDMHSKWWRQHRALLAELSGRDLERETRPRLAVVHLSYVDPAYLATGARQHDAWTSGDRHALPYQPRVILVVENRDCRLWFPEFQGTIVVEGGGKAAAAHLAQLEWVATAERVVYWGDIDSDGFAILAHLRKELRTRGVRVESLLMDDRTRAAYAGLGVSVDRSGRPIPPSRAHLQGLAPPEAACYAHVATSGPAPFRRIEQERIPMPDAVAALRTLLAHATSALPTSAIADQV